MSAPFDQERPDEGPTSEELCKESSFRRRVRAGDSTRRHQARELVQEHLLKDTDDPDGYRMDAVAWDEWSDFVDFAEAVLGDLEMLTWRIA